MAFRAYPVPLNPFMRAGIFKSADGKQGVGFVCDLRPSGSTVKTGNESGLQFLDLFGNRMAKADGTTLSYEPLYIKGEPERITEFFKSVCFIPKQSCRVFGRALGDRLYLTALNSFGQPGTIMTKFAPETGLPNIQFAFKDADDDSTVSFPLPANRQLSYRVESNGAELGGGKVEMTAPRSGILHSRSGKRCERADSFPRHQSESLERRNQPESPGKRQSGENHSRRRRIALGRRCGRALH